jgi:hypothetical protein
MDTFLAKIAFSMSTSTVGIMLSVVTTVYNNFLSPERLFVKIVDRFERNLFRLWSRSENNMLPYEIENFDEHRDPIEALASMALDKALSPHTKQKNNEDMRGSAPHTEEINRHQNKKDVA